MEINPETNLPDLPEGYWWEVQRDTDVGDVYVFQDLRVGIVYQKERLTYWRKKPTGKYAEAWFISKTADWEEFACSATPEIFVYELAEKVFKAALPLWRKEAQAGRVDSLLGTYPPKKLVFKR